MEDVADEDPVISYSHPLLSKREDERRKRDAFPVGTHAYKVLQESEGRSNIWGISNCPLTPAQLILKRRIEKMISEHFPGIIDYEETKDMPVQYCATVHGVDIWSGVDASESTALERLLDAIVLNYGSITSSEIPSRLADVCTIFAEVKISIANERHAKSVASGTSDPFNETGPSHK
jgi:hypothetical protein